MYWNEFTTVALIHCLAVMSPGPDFAVVLRQTLVAGRQAGMITALGVGTAIGIHVLYSLLGIGLLISQSIWLFSLLKWVGAGYLIYLGLQGLRSQPYPAQPAAIENAGAGHFWTGVITNGTNPKATLFFLSLFSVVIDPGTPLAIQAGYGIYMCLATALWFVLIAHFFGNPRIRRPFLRLGHWVDRLMGAALIALGIRLWFAAR